jgi:hypothetical protein
MEDNIGDIMEEIQSIVSNHLSDIKNEFKETIGILDTLPFVVNLRKKIRTLENENKQLKMLIQGIGEEKNIELEILEVKKNIPEIQLSINATEEDKEDDAEDGAEDDAEDGADDDDEEESNYTADSADEDELGIATEKPTEEVNGEDAQTI